MIRRYRYHHFHSVTIISIHQPSSTIFDLTDQIINYIKKNYLTTKFEGHYRTIRLLYFFQTKHQIDQFAHFEKRAYYENPLISHPQSKFGQNPSDFVDFPFSSAPYSNAGWHSAAKFSLKAQNSMQNMKIAAIWSAGRRRQFPFCYTSILVRSPFVNDQFRNVSIMILLPPFGLGFVWKTYILKLKKNVNFYAISQRFASSSTLSIEYIHVECFFS